MKGKAGSDNGWSKDMEEKQSGSEDDGGVVTMKTSFARLGGVASRHTICSWQ